MSNKNDKQDAGRLEWLVDKLRETEEERDNALECLRELQLDNLALQSKLKLLESILGDKIPLWNEDIPEDIDIPDDGEKIPYAN